MLAWFLSKNKPHKLITGLENCPKGREVAPLHGILYINFMHKCTMIYLLTTVEVWDVFFLRSLLRFPLSLVCTLIERIKTISHGENTAMVSTLLVGTWGLVSPCIHVSVVLRLFFTLRKYISSLHMQRFSSVFWPSWYSSLTKVSSKLDNGSWDALRALKC